MVIQKYDIPRIREICHGIKECDMNCLQTAADFFLNAGVVQENDVLIPAPQHTGRAEYTLQMAQMVAKETGAVVADCLYRLQGESLYKAKQEGRNVPPVFWMNGSIPAGRLIFVDNVIDTGVTFRAAEKAVGREMEPLVFACT